MKLTDHQQKMLDGAFGKGKAMAMQIQIGVGKCFDAERLVPVSRAHVSLSAQEADIWFAGKLLDAGASCAIAPTVNPGYSVDYFRSRLTDAAVENMRKTERIYRGLGARLTYCCTPYLADNVPSYGEIIAFSETNATIYANAVLGARTNRESAASALCAAVTGYAPEYGMLLQENRFADVAVRVDAKMKSDFDYAVLGLCGKKIGKGIPAFLGLPEKISTEALIALGAELNVSGSYDLYHIPNVTAEAAHGFDLFGGKAPKREVTITQSDLEQTLEAFSPSADGSIEYCILGCPHYTYAQIEEVERLLGGEKAKADIHILTSAAIKREAKESGLDEPASGPWRGPDRRHLRGRGMLLGLSCRKARRDGFAQGRILYGNGGHPHGRARHGHLHPLGKAGEGVLMKKTFSCRQIAAGKVRGEVLTCTDQILFYHTDPKTGVVTEVGHALEGVSVKDKILVFPGGKGSSVVQMDGLYKLELNGAAPLGFIVREPDTVLVSTAIIMEIPMVDHVEDEFYNAVKTGDQIEINASEELAAVTMLKHND